MPNKGITYDKRTRKWRARITVGKKIVELGRFTTEEEAIKAYDKIAQREEKREAKRSNKL